MPSGPKKRAKAKKKRQQHLGLHDDPDTQSRSSDDKETDTVDSVDDQEEDLVPKSPLGKSAYSRTADEDYKSQTEKWVRVSNFEVGLPTPQSEGSTIDFDHLIEDENNGTRSPDWEKVEGESVVGLDGSLPDGDRGDGVLTISHGVKPEELEAVLQSAEKDYFSPGRVEEPSKDGFDDTSAGGSLAVERGTEVPDYSVGSGTLPYGSSLHDSSEDQADYSTQNVLNVTGTDSKLAAGDGSAQAAEESSLLPGSDEQDFHAQVDNTARPQIDQPLSSSMDTEQQVEDDGGSKTYLSAVKAEPGEKIEGTGDQDSSIEDTLPESVEDGREADQKDDTEAGQKALAQVGDEHVDTLSESVEENTDAKSEDRHLYEVAESPGVKEGDESQTAEVAVPSREDELQPSSPHEKLIGIPDNHAEPETPTAESSAVSSSETGIADFSFDTPRIADGKQIEKQVPAEETALVDSLELPNVEAVNEGSIETNFEPQEERKDVAAELKDLAQSNSSENVHGLTNDHVESSPAEVAGSANGYTVEPLSVVAPPTAEKTLPIIFPVDNATVLTLSKVELLQAADGTSLGAIASLHPAAVSDIRPNDRVLVVEQAKDVRDRSTSGCCGVFYWVFGQADY